MITINRTFDRKRNDSESKSLKGLKTDLSKSLMLINVIQFSEMIDLYEDYFKWDDNMDKQLIELSNDDNPFFRVIALQLLSTSFLPKFEKIIIEKAKDENLFVRGEAVDLMRLFPESSFLDPLIDATKDEEPYVRFRAVHALRAFNSSKKIKIIEAIKKLNSDPDEDVRELAIDTIVEKDKYCGVDQLISNLEKENRNDKQKRRKLIADIISRMTYNTVLTMLRRRKYSFVEKILKTIV